MDLKGNMFAMLLPAKHKNISSVRIERLILNGGKWKGIGSGLPDNFLLLQNGKKYVYQITINIPNSHKLYQLAVKYTK
jgi:uncharacterized protein YunC (DUF1805 family)